MDRGQDSSWALAGPSPSRANPFSGLSSSRAANPEQTPASPPDTRQAVRNELDWSSEPLSLLLASGKTQNPN